MEKVKQTRQIQRSARKRVPYASVAFVGYTNAGKSTLFNKLSNSDVFAKDLLFATLDPSMRKIKLPSGREVVLSDTVGFISDLPHELVMSFRATLEEVLSADLVVHIRDIASSNTKEQKNDVLSVLESLGFNDFEKSPKYIEVLNKIDLFDEKKKKDIISKQKPQVVALSAINGEGCDNLLKLIDDKLSMDFEVADIELNVTEGKQIAWLHNNSEVISYVSDEEKMLFKVKISKENLAKFEFMK